RGSGVRVASREDERPPRAREREGRRPDPALRGRDLADDDVERERGGRGLGLARVPRRASPALDPYFGRAAVADLLSPLGDPPVARGLLLGPRAQARAARGREEKRARIVVRAPRERPPSAPAAQESVRDRPRGRRVAALL